jgi:hypothetical protein
MITCCVTVKQETQYPRLTSHAPWTIILRNIFWLGVLVGMYSPGTYSCKTNAHCTCLRLSLFFFEKGQELCHLLRRKKKLQYKNYKSLSPDWPRQQSTKATNWTCLSNSNFRWVDFSMKSPCHPWSPGRAEDNKAKAKHANIVTNQHSNTQQTKCVKAPKDRSKEKLVAPLSTNKATNRAIQCERMRLLTP